MSTHERSQDSASGRKKVTTNTLRRMKERGEKISALTAYDFTMGRILDEAGIDLVLVGDSVATVIQGRHTTLGATMDQMIYHCAMVTRAVERALVVGDLPFMSYQVNVDEALTNAGRLVKEAGVEAVKLEGGEVVCPAVRRLSEVGIPVMGHLGLTPQSIHTFGTYKVRATETEEANKLRRDARALSDAGVFSIVIEKVPAELAAEVAASVPVPIIGIGAGPGCDGQILVSHDMLGLWTSFRPRFVRRYAETADVMLDAFRRYRADVKENVFPSDSESY